MTARLAMAAAVLLATLVLVCDAYADGGCPDIIVATFGETAPQACSVSFCESTWRSWAISPDGANVGYFQINRVHGWVASTDPEVNVTFAYRLSRGGYDWSAWSCQP